MYPKFSLVGSIGLNAPDLTNLFSTSSQAFSSGPPLSWRRFDAGAIRKNIQVQSALQEQALKRSKTRWSSSSRSSGVVRH